MSCPAVIKVVTPGPPGATGPAGPAGLGSAWQQGEGAPPGGLGSDGDFYLNTTNGDIYGPKTAGAWGSVIFNIAEGQQGPVGPTGATGATGPAGADGRTLLSGTSAPASGTGEDGDFFINTNGSILYGPKAGGVWPGGVSIVGPAGATGATGPVGPTGATGATGPAGADATYSDETPQPLGIAAAGTAASASRADHVHALPAVATTSAAGLQSAADKAKLDGIDAGAQVNVATNLAYDAASREVRSSTGDDATLPLVSTSTAGLRAATSFSTITYAAQVALDFEALDSQYRTISLTGDLELTTSNLANGRSLVIRLVNDASQRTLTFPTDWKFLGTKPANIAASKVAVLSLTAFGTTNADVVAAYAVQS
jgi:hypothetical protein